MAGTFRGGATRAGDAGNSSGARAPKEGILMPGTRGRAAEAMPGDDIERLAQWMDSAFQIPGLKLRFGLDAIIGLIPGLGDTITSLISLYILSSASRFGVSRATMARMAANIAVDYVFGSIPLLGDVFDVYWKANQKNAALLRRHMTATSAVDRKKNQRGDRLFVAGLMLVLVALAVGSVMVAYSILAWIVSAIRG